MADKSNKRRPLLPNPLTILRQQKGIALFIALFAFSILSFVAIEVAYDTSVDHVVAAQGLNGIKAHYAAKAGMEISLLRIMLYKQAVSAFGDQLGGNTSMLDPIWQFPFMWPVAAMQNDKMSEVDKSMMQSAVKDSLMIGAYTTTIAPEGGRIDINDLGSDVKALREATQKQIMKVFQSEIEHNEDFRDKYSSFRFDELVNNITDYIDENTDGLNGSDESNPYRDLDDKDIKMPPNRPLRTVDELNQVGGMKDDIYKLLAPRVTVFGTKGVNVNYADKDLLMSLDPTMTEEAVAKVLERRSNPKLGGPFKNDQDFFGFIQNYGVNTRAIQETKFPLLYGMEFNFRIVSTGLSSNVQREITAITYDYENLAQRLADMMDKQDQDQSGGGGDKGDQDKPDDQSKDGDAAKTKIKTAKGRPTVVYWEEN